MSLTIEERVDLQWLEEGRDGVSGQRMFHVHIADLDDLSTALSTTGVPVIGAAHPLDARAKLRSRRLERHTDYRGAWWRIRCDYASGGSGGGGGFDPIPEEIGDSTTLIGSEGGQITVQAEPSGSNRPLKEPVAIGFNRPIRRVRVRKAANDYGWLAAWEALTIPETVNNNTVYLPPLQGNTGAVTCAAGTLIARSAQIVETGTESYVVEFSFAFSASGNHRFVAQGDRGPDGRVIVASIVDDFVPYRVADYPAGGTLWPDFTPPP